MKYYLVHPKSNQAIRIDPSIRAACVTPSLIKDARDYFSELTLQIYNDDDILTYSESASLKAGGDGL